MLRIVDLGISPATRAHLAERQAEINAIPDFPTRVRTAKSKWANGKRNRAFEEVKAQLTKMCRGAKRCAYCEDSAADEIEHIAPKDSYPERTFDWTNYLYACGPCNGPKGKQYRIRSTADGSLIDIENLSDPPPPGDPLLINPREENPLDLLWLDLETFAFVPNLDEEAAFDYQRAAYTIDVALRLNERDHLRKARKLAAKSYLALLAQYVLAKEAANQKEMDNLRTTIAESNHPTVWAELVRQRKLHPRSQDLFAAAPEALEF